MDAERIDASNLRESLDFSGTYRNVPFLIRMTKQREMQGEKYYYPAKENWAHYIFLSEQRVPTEKRHRWFLPAHVGSVSTGGREYVSYNYCAEGALPSALEWHGGITFYDYVEQTPGHRAIKMGCDYQHSWDEGCHYDVSIVAWEVQKTIDSLWSYIPDMLVQHWYTGKWVTRKKAETALAAKLEGAAK